MRLTWLLGSQRSWGFFDACLFVYSCSQLSRRRRCIHPNTNAACRHSVCKANWSTQTKKSLPGARHFEIKSMSSHSALVPGTRKGARNGEGAPPECCDFRSRETFLSSLRNQKTSSRKGGRIRGERKRAGSLILMGFRGATITAEMLPVCVEDQPRVRTG